MISANYIRIVLMVCQPRTLLIGFMLMSRNDNAVGNMAPNGRDDVMAFKLTRQQDQYVYY
jgi:hypothetical protein